MTTRFTLPRNPDPAQSDRSQLARRSGDQKSGWVYIVDDDEAILKGLDLLARSYGLHCRTFRSAIEYLSATPPESHACLLLDLNMPVMTGLDLLRVLKGRGSLLPIVIMTAGRDSIMLSQVRALLSTAILPKPFQGEEFEAAISAALKSAQLV